MEVSSNSHLCEKQHGHCVKLNVIKIPKIYSGFFLYNFTPIFRCFVVFWQLSLYTLACNNYNYKNCYTLWKPIGWNRWKFFSYNWSPFFVSIFHRYFLSSFFNLLHFLSHHLYILSLSLSSLLPPFFSFFSFIPRFL